MGPSSPLPPGDGNAAEEAVDELDMTSVMDRAQTRALLNAARLAREAEQETTRPPPAATGFNQVEVAIPVASAIPLDAAPTPEPAPLPAAPSVTAARSAVATPVAGPSMTWVVVAFVLLAAAIAFALR
jgi:hypothetical protein